MSLVVPVHSCSTQSHEQQHCMVPALSCSEGGQAEFLACAVRMSVRLPHAGVLACTAPAAYNNLFHSLLISPLSSRPASVLGLKISSTAASATSDKEYSDSAKEYTPSKEHPHIRIERLGRPQQMPNTLCTAGTRVTCQGAVLTFEGQQQGSRLPVAHPGTCHVEVASQHGSHHGSQHCHTALGARHIPIVWGVGGRQAS